MNSTLNNLEPSSGSDYQLDLDDSAFFYSNAAHFHQICKFEYDPNPGLYPIIDQHGYWRIIRDSRYKVNVLRDVLPYLDGENRKAFVLWWLQDQWYLNNPISRWLFKRVAQITNYLCMAFFFSIAVSLASPVSHVFLEYISQSTFCPKGLANYLSSSRTSMDTNLSAVTSPAKSSWYGRLFSFVGASVCQSVVHFGIVKTLASLGLPGGQIYGPIVILLQHYATGRPDVNIQELPPP